MKDKAIEEKAVAYCKAFGYSITGSQYSAFISGSHAGKEDQQVTSLKDIEGLIEAEINLQRGRLKGSSSDTDNEYAIDILEHLLTQIQNLNK
jgi:hypothetical protein